jgi:glycosyltransferase involved in cell wall biosynthesis
MTGSVERPILLSVAIAPGLGGSMRSLATVLSELDGFDRAVACPAGTTFTDFLETRHLYEELVPLAFQGRSRLLARIRAAFVIAVWSWSNRHRLAAIHANGLAERNIVVLAALVTRVPVVVWMHEWSVSPWAKRVGPLLSKLVRDTRFAAVSTHARDVLADARLAAKSDIEVVPNPIDPADVVAHERVLQSGLTVAYLGTPARYKGFHLLPAIIRALADHPVRWVIYAGPTSLLPEVWAALDAIDDVDIDIPGKVNDVRQAYGRCDIVLCPSLHETFGRVAAEAMCNGLPVVASDIPPLRDLIGNDEAGLLVEPEDVEAIADALRRLIADASLREKLGAAGRQRASIFEPRPIVHQLASMYSGSRGLARQQ